MITKMINGQERPVSNSGDSLGPSVMLNGNPLSFSKDTAGLASNTVITLEPIQAGTGDPSPSNVRAISGYDQINILINKKNLLNKSAFTKNKCVNTSGKIIDSDGIYLSNRIYVKSGTDYYLTNGIGGDSYYTGCAFDANGNVTGSIVIYGGQVASGKITTPANASYILLNIRTSAVDTCQFEEGSTGTSYESYDPDISIAMPGTVYGGTLDVESGELVVTHEKVVLNGTELWYEWDNGYYVANPGYTENMVINSICDKFKYSTSRGVSGTFNQVSTAESFSQLFCYSGVSSLNDWKTYVSNNNITLIIPLATPITYYLTPHQVALLQGANVVTTNGTSISLTHRQGEIAAQEDLVALAESVNATTAIADYARTHSANYLTSIANNSSSKTYEMLGNTHSILFIIGGDAKLVSFIFTNWNATVSSHYEIGQTTGVTVTTSGNLLTIANSTGASIYIYQIILNQGISN